MKIAVVKILKEFVIETDQKFSKLELEMQIHLKVCGGYKVKLKARK